MYSVKTFAFHLKSWRLACSYFPFSTTPLTTGGDHLRGKPERDLERPALNFLTDRINLTILSQVKNISVHLYKDYCQLCNMTGLHFASVFGLYTLAAKLLLEKGAEVDPKDSYGRPPLLLAAENGHEAVVRLLLDKGAKVDSEDIYGQTLLPWVAQSGHQAIVTLLLENGAEVDSKDSGGQKPLSWVA